MRGVNVSLGYNDRGVTHASNTGHSSSCLWLLSCSFPPFPLPFHSYYQCPYRHNSQVKMSRVVCQKWQQKTCHDVHCPNRHPGNMQWEGGGGGGRERERERERGREGGREREFANVTLFLPFSSAILGKLGSSEQLLGASSFSSDLDMISTHSNESPDFELLSDSSSDMIGDHRELSSPSPDQEEWPQIEMAIPSPPSHSPSMAMRGVKLTMKSASSTGVSAPYLSTSFHEDDEFEGAVGGFGAVRDNGEAAMFDSDPEGEEEEEDELNLSSQPDGFIPLLSLTSLTTSTQPDDELGDLGWERGTKDQRLAMGSALKRIPVLRTASPRMEQKTKKPELSRSSAGAVSPVVSAPLPRPPVQLEPVGLFWDIENCHVPLDKSAFALANKLRKEFFHGKREAEFMCVCDITKERKEVVDGLSKAHVSQVITQVIMEDVGGGGVKGIDLLLWFGELSLCIIHEPLVCMWSNCRLRKHGRGTAERWYECQFHQMYMYICPVCIVKMPSSNILFTYSNSLFASLL